MGYIVILAIFFNKNCLYKYRDYTLTLRFIKRRKIMGINEVTNQTAVSGSVVRDGEESRKVVQPKIEVGAAMLDKSGKKVGAGTLGLGAEVNLGKGWTIEPEVKGYAGSGVIGGGAQIDVGKQLNPHLQVNAGVGFDRTHFSHSTTLIDTLDEVVGGTAPDEDFGGRAAMEKGDYEYSRTGEMYSGTKSGQTTAFAKIGAKYSPNKKLSFTGNVELGAKSLNGDYKIEKTHYEGVYCTEGAKYEPQYIDPNDPDLGTIMVRTEPAKLKEFTLDETQTAGGKKKSFTSRIGLGAEYNINEHISAGVSAHIGLNKNSDDFFGAKIAYKF